MSKHLEVVNQALALYGASLNENGNIVSKDGKVSMMQVVKSKNRLHFETNGTLYASTPINVNGVCKFVESFWYWTKI